MQKTLKDLNKTWKGTFFEKKHFLDTYDNEFFKFKDFYYNFYTGKL